MLRRSGPVAPVPVHPRTRQRRAGLIAGLLALAPACLPAATFTVTRTADDSSAGSLRWAVAQANATGGFDQIRFDLPSNSVIQLNSALPSISGIGGSVNIAGPGAAELTIDGVNDSFDGFTIGSGNTLEVQGLTLRNFARAIQGSGGSVFTVLIEDAAILSSGQGAIVDALGAVAITGGRLTMNRVRLADNSGYLGGALSFRPSGTTHTLTVRDCSFENNTANGGGGGALMIRSTLNQSHTITASTFSGNSGASAGALLLWSETGATQTTTILNSTFSGNQATDASGADAVLATGNTQATVRFSTFSGHDHDSNSATAGVLHATNGADLVLSGSLVVNNPASGGGSARECTAGTGGATFNGDNNFTADPFCPGRIGSATQISATLANNGGPTRTHLPSAGSNVLGAYTGSNCPGPDQRGQGRPSVDADCDIGAVQVSGFCAGMGPDYTLTGSSNSARISELRSAIECANNSGDNHNTIRLGGNTLDFTDAYADYTGQTALPQVLTPITLRDGNFSRSGATLARFLAVGSTGVLTLRDLVLTNGGGSGYSGDGGAVLNQGELRLLRTRISSASAVNGGALRSTDTLRVVNSILSGNVASGEGGALYVSGSVRVSNSVISGNRTNTRGTIRLIGSAQVTLINATVSGNLGAAGMAGIYIGTNGSAGFTRSIVWNNSLPSIDSEPATSNSRSSSLIEGVDGTAPVFVTPLLPAAAPSTGGNLRLQSNSSGVDAVGTSSTEPDTDDLDEDGNTTEVAPDVTGSPRLSNDPATPDPATAAYLANPLDIGAYELQGTNPCAGLSFPYTLAGANNTARVAALRLAMRCANDTLALDRIDLAGQTVDFSDAFGDYIGLTALPLIGAPIELRNGSLQRSGGTEFRLLSANADLTLRRVNLLNGGGASYAGDGALVNSGVFATLRVLDSTLSGGRTSGRGGALKVSDDLFLQGVTLEGNQANEGGALFLDTFIAAQLDNCVISGNVANTSGGAIQLAAGSLSLRHSTLTGNYAASTNPSHSGGLVRALAANLQIHNSVLWANRNVDDSAPQISTTGTGSGTATVSDSLIEGGHSGGIRILTGDPLFASGLLPSATPSTNGDFRLGNASPAIDVSNQAQLAPDLLDFDGDSDVTEAAPDRAGNPRSVDDIAVPDNGQGTAPFADFGALERQTASALPTDVAVTLSNGTSTVVPGTSPSWTLVASNAGPAAANATVSSAIDGSVTGLSFSVSGSGGADCGSPASGSGQVNRSLSLPVGASCTFTLTGSVPAAATGALNSSASISLSGATDPQLANNSASDNDTLDPQTDLAVSKTDGQTTDTPGTSITYTIVASNAGPSSAPGVSLSDVFPATLTGISWSAMATGGAGCSGSGTGSIFRTINLPPGSSCTFTANATISAGASGTLSNTAAVSPGAGQTDPVTGNNSATDTTLLVTPVSIAIGDVSQAEGNSGSTTFNFTVQLSGPAGPGGVQFDLATADGTAAAGSDYTARTLSAQSIAQGNSSSSVAVTVQGDTTVEPNETFFVNLSNVTGASVSDGQGVGTITNDDVAADFLVTTTASSISVTDSNGNGAALAASEPLTNTLRFDAPGRTFSVNGTPISGNSGNLALTGITSITLNASGGTTVASGAVFNIGAATLDAASPVTLAGGTLKTLGSSARVLAPLVLSADSDLQGSMQLAGAISGNFTLRTFASGNYRFDSTGNSFARLQISSGIVALGGNQTLPPQIDIFNSATFDLNGFDQTADFYASSGSTINSGAAADLTLGVAGSSSTFGAANYTGAVSGPIHLSIAAGASQILGGSNSHVGATDILGALRINGSTTLGAVGPGNGTSVSATGALELRNVAYAANEAVNLQGGTLQVLTGSSSFPGPITLSGGPATLRVAGSVDTLRLDGVINGSQGFGKTGDGQLELTAANTFSGPVTVNAGRLLVSGSTVPASAFSVAAGGTLGGSGTVGGTVGVASGGVLAPGAGPGMLGTGALTLNGGATFAVEINGPAAGTQYDRLAVSGTVNLGGATLQLAGAHVAAVGQSFLLVDNDGSDPVSGSFAGLPNGGTRLFNGVLLTIQYDGGDGNDVVLRADPAVRIGVSPASVSEDGATLLTYTLTRDASLPTATTVQLTTAGTATPGSDYTGAVASVVIPANTATASFQIDPTVDGTVEPAETVIITVAPGAGYNVGAPASATGSILNDDLPTATISVTPAGGVLEDGASNLEYEVVLNQAPVAPVAVNFSLSGSATAGTDFAAVSTPLNFSVGQTTATLLIDPTADTDIEGDETVIVTLDSAPGYNVGVPASATGTIRNDELPALRIDDLSQAEGNSGTSTATFTVRLDRPAPPGGVQFDIATADGSAQDDVPSSEDNDYVARALSGQVIAEGQTTLDFAVTLNGDARVESDESFVVNVSNVLGATVADAQATGTLVNDDSAAITVTPSTGLVTTESGGTASFTVVLGSEPTATVSVGLSSSDPSEGTASPVTLSFSPANWNTAQTVTITGVDDPLVDGTIAYSIVTAAASSADPQYSGRDAADVAVSNADNDSASLSIVESGGITAVTEGGATDSFTVVLSAQPSANVQITLSGTQVGAAPTPLSFTSANWDQAQTVTISALDDAIAEGSHSGSVSLSVSSADPNYQGLSVTPVTVSITDNDSVGLSVVPSDGSTSVTEGGATDTFTVALTSQPGASVTVTLAGTQVGATPSPLSFSAADWNIAQSVTVTAVDDAVVEGHHAGSVGFTVASADAAYQMLSVPALAVSISDNDNAGISVTPSSGLTTSEAGGSASFTVVLNSPPAAAVVIGLSTSDATEGTVSPAALNFTTVNWNAPQTVTVTGVDDALDDGDVSYSIRTAPTVSSDPAWQGVDAADVSLSNTDNDATPTFAVGPVLQRQQGSPASVGLIGTVADADQAAGGLEVTQLSGGTAGGITVSAITNVDGQVSAQLAASCSASDGTLRFQVRDAGNLTATAELAIDVLDNSAPQLSYGLQAIGFGGSATVQPASGPLDNGSVASISLANAGSFTGTVSIAADGVVSLGNARPAGPHVLLIRATDDCGASADVPLNLSVGPTSTFKLVTADVSPSRFGQTVTFSAQLAGLNPTGSVEFFAGGSSLGTAPLVASPSGGANLKLAQLSTSALPVGSQAITAVYAGDAGNAGSTSPVLAHSVLASSTRITLTASQPAAPGSQLISVTVSAEAPGGGIPAGSVLISADGQPCTAVLSGGVGSCALNFATPGMRLLSANYTPTGNSHLASTGNAPLVIVGPGSSTDLRVRIGNGQQNVSPGQSVTWMVVVDNLGSEAALGRLQVPQTAGLGGASWFCSAAPGAVCGTPSSGSGAIDSTVSLAPGGVAVYAFTAIVAAGPEQPLTQTATITPVSPTTDPVPANNTASDTDPMGLLADGFEDDSAE